MVNSFVKTTAGYPIQVCVNLRQQFFNSKRLGNIVVTPGGECLFCHRSDVGPTWAVNPHGQTMRFNDGESDAINALDVKTFAENWLKGVFH